MELQAARYAGLEFLQDSVELELWISPGAVKLKNPRAVTVPHARKSLPCRSDTSQQGTIGQHDLVSAGNEPVDTLPSAPFLRRYPEFPIVKLFGCAAQYLMDKAARCLWDAAS
ncbi:MAG: hypothetical protein H6839_02630 [Planctomycetes bacterium]|nr:hypothetical protein [Planctomycetota bacterium]